MAITISEALTRPSRQLNQKTTLLALRGVIALLMFCFLSFNPNLEKGSLFLPMLLVAIYCASDVALIWVPLAAFDDALAQSGLLLFDVGVISGIIYACQGFDSDLYLIYFVVLLMSGMQMRIWQSLLTGFVASVFYVTLWQRANPGADVWDANILLRLPFFYIVALSAAFFAQQSRDREERAKEAASTGEKVKMETIFSQMKDGAVLTNERGEIVLSNASARDFLSLESDSRVPLSSRLSSMKVEPPFAALLASVEPAIAFEMLREEHKTLILAGTATRMRFEAAGRAPAWHGRLFVFRDVTAERGEERLKRSFLSLISHKLRTPLSVIIGFVELLLKDEIKAQGDGVRRKSYESIESQAQKLASLIEKLLDFMSLQEMEPLQLAGKPFLLAESARGAEADLKDWLAGRGAVIEYRLPEDLEACGDPALIQRVFKNLIENAVKFTPKPEKKVLLEAERKGDVIEVRVTDEGGGIPPEDLDRITGKFFQSEPAFTGNIEGWGLGLAFVKLAVERHGGKFEVSSLLSKGTVVTFTLAK
jgi:signal transduction histidine kinase